MFPYSLIQAVHREYWVVGWMRVSDIQARWVIFYFIGFDLLYQLLFRGADGVGHLAHLGGFAAGFLIVLIMRARRDNEDVSNVQAVRSEMKDYSLLSFNDLSTLMQQPTEDMALVAAYCEKSLTNSHGARPDYCYAVVSQYQNPLMEQADPERLAWIVLSLHPSYGSLPPVYYLRLASRLESRASNDYACRLYQRVYELNPSGPETETALYRWGSLMQRAFNNPQQAQSIFNELFRLFPHGEMAEYARRTAAGAR
jgi:tetratricopeptide (TPR) repeat protein